VCWARGDGVDRLELGERRILRAWPAGGRACGRGCRHSFCGVEVAEQKRCGCCGGGWLLRARGKPPGACSTSGGSNARRRFECSASCACVAGGYLFIYYLSLPYSLHKALLLYNITAVVLSVWNSGLANYDLCAGFVLGPAHCLRFVIPVCPFQLVRPSVVQHYAFHVNILPSGPG
jgi:hypothetical protein